MADKLTFDLSKVLQLSRKLDDASRGREFGKTEMGSAMRRALRPMLKALRSELPIKTKNSTGATRRDARIKIVPGSGEAVIRGLVGINKKRGHAGWYTSFNTLGTKQRRTKKGYNRGRIIGDNYMDRARDQGLPFAVSSLQGDARTIVEKIIKRAQQ